MTSKALVAILLCPLAMLIADEPQLKSRQPLPPNGQTEYRVEQGKHIPVRLLSTVALHAAGQRDHAYFQTVYPVVVLERTLIPAGSYLDAQVSEIKRIRPKGRSEFYVRLGRLTLPNGKQRQLSPCKGTMMAAVSIHGASVFIMPETTADIILEDPIVFPVEEAPNR